MDAQLHITVTVLCIQVTLSRHHNLVQVHFFGEEQYCRNNVLSRGIKLNSNIMTIFTYPHFCLEEQTLAILSVSQRANIWKGEDQVRKEK